GVDRSTDHTADICMKAVKLKECQLPRITYLLNEHSGLSVARNTGVFISKGDMIAYIDGDAIADEHWVLEIAKTFNNDDTIGAVGGKIEILNTESWFALFIHWIHYYMEGKNGEEVIPLIGTNMAFRKEVFQERGGFFENFKSRGDETSFTKLKVLPYFKQKTTADAVVHHERPWTFHQSGSITGF
ncbi:MAG: glycosyltransferase, partial [Candidatus Neomarinimicrobiota bacterium]|nr:glycosyltransferase [Candidatus Neomarinimicrobiota bacterium]